MIENFIKRAAELSKKQLILLAAKQKEQLDELLKGSQTNKSGPIGSSRYQIRWKIDSLENAENDYSGIEKNWLYFGTSLDDILQFKNRMRDYQINIIGVTAEKESLVNCVFDDQAQIFRVNSNKLEHFIELWTILKKQEKLIIDGIIFCWGKNRIIGSNTELNILKFELEEVCSGLLYLLQALVKQEMTHNMKLCYVTENSEYLEEIDTEQKSLNLLTGSLRGLLTTAAVEYPELNILLVDFDDLNHELNVKLLAKELYQFEYAKRLAYRKNKRYKAELNIAESKHVLSSTSFKPTLQENASYLITGGLGSLGLKVAHFLVENGARSLILTSRSSEINDHTQKILTKLKLNNANITIIKNDIANKTEVEQLFNSILPNMPPLKGIIHAAGILDDGILPQQTYQRFLKVFEAKVFGAWNLQQASINLDLDFFILFSSIASQIGSLGQSNYATANAFLDSLAQYRTLQGLKATSINWGPWKEIGMAAHTNVSEEFTRHGLKMISAEDALQQFGYLLKFDTNQVLVANFNTEKIDFNVISKLSANLLSSVILQKHKDSQVSTSFIPEDPLDIMMNSQASQREVFVEKFLIEKIKNVLGISKQFTIKEDTLFVDLGLDSMLAIELRNKLSTALKIALPVGLLYNYPNLKDLKAYFIQLLSEKVTSETNTTVSERTIEEESKQESSEAIAIIGMSCRFPGSANSPDEYWQLLENGICAVKKLNNERWIMDDYYDPDPNVPGKMYSRFAGILDEIQQFDAEFFGISPREALSLDPQQRLLLELSWEVLENAGYNPNDLRGSKGGIFIGPGPNEYSKVISEAADIDLHMGTGNAPSMMAGRLSYHLGWNGPGMVVDTACSSSLVSVHLASQSLCQFECNMAIAGGINLMLRPEANIVLSKSRMLAKDGLCKTFDASADGYVRSEGAGLVVLKRLSDAIKDKDNILAVIRATAINQDGRSQGLTAPNGAAQENLLKETLNKAHINPSDIQIVEAHGTGTALGDPIEMNAIYNVYGQNRNAENPLYVSSVKTNLGHTESAAGIAGLIKLILSLENQKIPKHLHLNSMNPLLGLSDVLNKSLLIPVALTEWKVFDKKLRRAALSSFGFSGTNAHLILEERPKCPEKINIVNIESNMQNIEYYILTLSAKTVNALEELVKKYIMILEKEIVPNLIDICNTANMGRSNFEYRVAFIFTDPDSLKKALRGFSVQKAIENNEVSQLISEPIILYLTEDLFELMQKCHEVIHLMPALKQEIEECLQMLNDLSNSTIISLLNSSKHGGITEKVLFILGALYQLGYNINWIKYYQNSAGKKINLPTYPFQRKKYWIENEAKVKDSFFKGFNHPILGYDLPVPISKEKIYYNQFTTDNPSYLKDHKVFDHVVVPGASHTAMLLSAACLFLKKSDCVLEDIHFPKALVIAPKETFQVMVVHESLENGKYIKILSRKAQDMSDSKNDDWNCHASAMVKNPESNRSAHMFDIPHLEIPSVKPHFDQTTFYNRMWEQGYHLGPSHQCVKEGWVNHNRVIIKMTLEAISNKMNDYELFPGLIDSCQQAIDRCETIYRAKEKNDNIIYIPYGVESLYYCDKPKASEDLWCVINHNIVASTKEIINCDIYLYHNNGKLIAAMRGYKSLLTSRNTFLSLTQQENWLYKIIWEHKELSRHLLSSSKLSVQMLKQEGLQKTAAIKEKLEFSKYRQAVSLFEGISLDFVLQSLTELGIQFIPSKIYKMEDLIHSLGIVTKQRRLFIHCIEVLQKAGCLEIVNDEVRFIRGSIRNPIRECATLKKEFPEAMNEIILLERCGSHLAKIFIGAEEPLSLLFSENTSGNSQQIYKTSIGSLYLNAQIATIVNQIKESISQNQLFRILEVGSGTGGTSETIIPLLMDCQGPVEYYFTDVSKAFVEKARKNFNDYGFVKFQLFDLEKKPINQGMALESFDLVIASNVIHITKNIVESLNNISQVLKNGGKLILLECTSRPLWLDITFGLTEGWWRFEDQKLRSHPLLLAREWQSLLATSGFENCEILSEELFPSDAVIVAEKNTAFINPQKQQDIWLLLLDSSELSDNVVQELENAGKTVLKLYRGSAFSQSSKDVFYINSSCKQDYSGLLNQILEQYSNISGIVHLWSHEISSNNIIEDNKLELHIKQNCEEVLYLLQELLSSDMNNNPKFYYITRNCQCVTMSEQNIQLSNSAIVGMCRVFNNEHPELNFYVIDTDNQSSTKRLMEEFLNPNAEMLTCFREDKRYVPRLTEYTLPTYAKVKLLENPIKQDASYLITGAFGALGLLAAEYLVHSGAKFLILIGRSEMNHEAKERVAEWQKKGVKIIISKLDISNYASLETAFNTEYVNMPGLKGVIHAAGTLRDASFLQQSWDHFNEVLSPKIQGAWNLHRLTQLKDLDYFILFSSVTSIMGTSGQANHAAANAFLDGLAFYRKQLGLCCMTINWGAWAKIGAAAKRLIGEMHAAVGSGIGTIAPEQGIGLFANLLTCHEPQVIAMPLDWKKYSHYPMPPMQASLLEKFLKKNEMNIQNTEETRNLHQNREPNFISILTEMPVQDRKPALMKHLQEKVAHTLGMNRPEMLLPHHRFFDIGMDSLMALDLKNILQNSLTQKLRSTLLFDYSTFESLTNYLLDEVLKLSTTPITSGHEREVKAEKTKDSDLDIVQRLEKKLQELSH